jgi:hypothetical protein
MRVFQAVSLGAAAVILTASAATAQGLADAAAREREKRKGKAQGSAKVITEEELRKAGGNVSSPAATDGGTGTSGTSTTGTTPGQGDATAGAKPPAKAADEKSPEQIKAEQTAVWRQKLDLARKQVGVYQDLIKALQSDLNDMSGGVYTPRRAAAQTNLEQTQKELLAAQQTVADLEAEGQRNGYR